MGVLDCVAPGKMLSASTEVFNINLSADSRLNENVSNRTDIESQTSSTADGKHSIWWKIAIDIPLLTLVCIIIGLLELQVIPNHKAGFYCNDPKLSFPYNGDTVPDAFLVISVIFFPALFIFPIEYLFLHSENINHSRLYQALKNTYWLVKCYFYGLLINVTIIEVMKVVSGNPRPTFFALCAPDTGKTCNGTEFVPTFKCTSTYTRFQQSDSYHSFPSGHTSMSVYCGFFIVWYLQRRAFDWSNRNTFSVLILQVIVITYSVVCSLTRITDNRHHWWDVLAGTGIGFLCLFYVITIANAFSYFTLKLSKKMELQQSGATILFEGR